MKAFVVTVLAPSDWNESDICSSVHIGMREYAKQENRELNAMDYNAMTHAKFELKRGGS